ncbi:MAG: hypothetical protein KDK37_06635 [Leptospiraceae bacterium]|nr:hypothetical protein [Leptospiraceae bacterium]MCB1303933.1 hypothetical protein [Leptospiraceae bacterium]
MMRRSAILYFICLLALSASACHLFTTTTQAPTAQDDPFFQEKPVEDEVFRILITEDEYILRQVSANDLIYAKPDPKAQELSHKLFKEYNQKWNFMDSNHEGLLRVKLNPQTGLIENVDYEGGKSPRAWQASIMFRDDLLRYKFGFKAGIVQPREFKVRYQWRINRDPSLSPEEAKRKAMEFIKEQKI